MIDFPPLNTTPTISSRVRGVYLAQESGYFKAPSFVPGIPRACLELCGFMVCLAVAKQSWCE